MGTFVEVAIGLTLMYLVLSLVCTVINEFISTIASLRARFLASELWQILDGKNNPELAKAFYTNGVISATSSAAWSRTGDAKPATVDLAANTTAQAKGSRPQVAGHPSYLDGHTFADAVTSV